MRRLLHILDSGWFFLLAMAVLIAEGKFGGLWLQWAGTALVVLCIIAGGVGCARRIRAGRYLRRKIGVPDESAAEK